MPYANDDDRRARQRKLWHEKYKHRNKKTATAEFPTPEQLARRSLDWKAIGEAYKGHHD